jgi:hypothetical protein
LFVLLGGIGAVGPAPMPTPTVPTATTGEVTATSSLGGLTILTTPEGATAKIEVPANAVTADTIVKVEQVRTPVVSELAPPPTSKTLVSAFELSATSAGVALTSFAQPITITLTYTDEQITGLDEETLKIYRWTGLEWQALSTTINIATNTLTTTTSQFSYLAIIGEEKVIEKPIEEMRAEELKARIIEIQKQIIEVLTTLRREH